MDSLGLTTLKDIALKEIHRNRLPMSEYKLIIGLIADGMRDLKLFTMKGSNAVRLKMNIINCIELPEDYLSFISLSVPYRGRLFTMTEDKMIVSPMSISNGIDVLNKDKGEGIFTDSLVSESYNSGGGQNDYKYHIEVNNRRIVIDGFSRTEVTLAYKSNGISQSGATLIPSVAEESLLSWVDWKRAKGNKEALSTILNLEKDYNAECYKLQSLESPSLDALYDVFYSTLKQGVKR